VVYCFLLNITKGRGMLKAQIEPGDGVFIDTEVSMLVAISCNHQMAQIWLSLPPDQVVQPLSRGDWGGMAKRRRCYSYIIFNK
jgi:hypothetical protein